MRRIGNGSPRIVSDDGASGASMRRRIPNTRAKVSCAAKLDCGLAAVMLGDAIARRSSPQRAASIARPGRPRRRSKSDTWCPWPSEASCHPSNLAPQCAKHNTELGVSVHPKAPLREVAHATIYVAGILINSFTLTKRELLIVLRALPSIERYWENWPGE